MLLRKNWRAIGDESKMRAGTVWIVVSVLMLIPSIFFGVGAFLYVIVWYFMWQRPQAKYVRERWGKEYPRKGWGMPLAVAVAVYVLLVAILAAVIAALGPTVTR